MKSGPHTLSSLVPHGLVVARSWLTEKSIGRHTIDNWVKSGQLVALSHGVFVRPETELTWQGVVVSLQKLGHLQITPGGLTALTLQGMAHYLSPNEQTNIHLYGEDKLPPWTNEVLPGTVFVHHRDISMGPNDRALDPASHLVSWRIQRLPYGYDKWPMQISSPELAILEVLLDVPQHVSFEHADQLVQGLPTLSPQRLARLLDRCNSVKVKRLFLWLAEKNQSPWLKKIDLEKFSIESGNLGSGKRMIAEGGKLDSKYLITVPRDMLEEAYG